jgi:hypothetical protein
VVASLGFAPQSVLGKSGGPQAAEIAGYRHLLFLLTLISTLAVGAQYASSYAVRTIA